MPSSIAAAWAAVAALKRARLRAVTAPLPHEGRRGVERHGVETLPLGVEKMPGRQVAAEEAALDEPADFPCGEVDSADPREIKRADLRYTNGFALTWRDPVVANPPVPATQAKS